MEICRRSGTKKSVMLEIRAVVKFLNYYIRLDLVHQYTCSCVRSRRYPTSVITIHSPEEVWKLL